MSGPEGRSRFSAHPIIWRRFTADTRWERSFFCGCGWLNRGSRSPSSALTCVQQSLLVIYPGQNAAQDGCGSYDPNPASAHKVLDTEDRVRLHQDILCKHSGHYAIVHGWKTDCQAHLQAECVLPGLLWSYTPGGAFPATVAGGLHGSYVK